MGIRNMELLNVININMKDIQIMTSKWKGMEYQKIIEIMKYIKDILVKISLMEKLLDILLIKKIRRKCKKNQRKIYMKMEK